MQDTKKLLIDFLNLYSVRSGEEFELASGEKSNVYVDVKKTAFHSRITKILAQLLCDKITKEFWPIQAVAGVVLGGCHLASIVAATHPMEIHTVHVRKEPKDHGTKQLIERPIMIKYDAIVVLEDVVTTGKSAIRAAELLRNEGYDVKGILAVVDRRSKKTPYLGSFDFAALVNFEELAP